MAADFAPSELLGGVPLREAVMWPCELPTTGALPLVWFWGATSPVLFEGELLHDHMLVWTVRTLSFSRLDGHETWIYGWLWQMASSCVGDGDSTVVGDLVRNENSYGDPSVQVCFTFIFNH